MRSQPASRSRTTRTTCGRSPPSGSRRSGAQSTRPHSCRPSATRATNVAARIPKYAFVGGNWPAHDPNGEDPASLVRYAFEQWSKIRAHEPGLRTGVGFHEVPATATADVEVVWRNDAGLNNGGIWEHTNRPRTLAFDSSMSWYFKKWPNVGHPGGLQPTQWHFLSVALHETGHVVGLFHQRRADSVMHAPAGKPPSVFMFPDSGSQEGVRDLYSIRVAAPTTGTVVGGDEEKKDGPGKSGGCGMAGSGAPRADLGLGALLLAAIAVAARRAVSRKD